MCSTKRGIKSIVLKTPRAHAYKNHAKSPGSDLLKAKKDAIFRSVDSLSICLIGMNRVISHTYTTPAPSFLPLFIRLPPTNQKNPRQKEFFFSHPPLHP